MQCTIKSVRQIDATIITDVESVIDGKTVQMSITHAQPRDIDDIYVGIKNRILNESSMSECKAVCEELIPDIPVGKVITLS